MADTSAMADIRGIDIDKLAKGFAEEKLVLRNYVVNSKTSAREIRWYQKTAGFLDSTDTTDITASQIYNTASKSLPVVVEQSWTRNTSYVKNFKVESPWFSIEDLNDTDIDLLAENIHDLVRGLQNQVEKRIYSVLTEALTPVNIQTAAATADGWDDDETGNPIADMLAVRQAFKTYSYSPEGAICYISPDEEAALINYLISVKGSSIPGFASEKVKSGVVMELLGFKIVTSENATATYATFFIPNKACTWKSFMPLRTFIIDDPGIGKKFRVIEEGEAILTDPKAVFLMTAVTS